MGRNTKRPGEGRLSSHSGGSGEIRTHDGFPHAGFQDRCIQPLCHRPAVSIKDTLRTRGFSPLPTEGGGFYGEKPPVVHAYY